MGHGDHTLSYVPGCLPGRVKGLTWCGTLGGLPGTDPSPLVLCWPLVCGKAFASQASPESSVPGSRLDDCGAFLVAQRSSIQCRRDKVPSRDPGRSHMPSSNSLTPSATTTEPVLQIPGAAETEACKPESPYSMTREAIATGGPHTTMKHRHCSPQLEKALATTHTQHGQK